MSNWASVRLDDVARRGSGHTPSKQHPEYWEGPIKWVSLKDTFRLDQGLIEETTATITEAGLAHSSAVIHDAGSVVLLRDAGVGKSAVLGSDMAVSQHFMAWSCGPRLYNWFLYYLLQARKPEFERISNGSTIKTIGLDYFRQLKVPLPEVDEQRRIADVLTVTDRFVDSLAKRVAKTMAIKQGMMQQLLSGRTRLPGFEDEWSLDVLGSRATGLRGSGLSKEMLEPAGSQPCILYGELFTTYGRRIDHVQSRTSVGSGVRSVLGDVLVPGSTTTIARDLATASALHEAGVLIGGDINIVRPGTGLDPDWLAYSVTHSFGDRVSEIAQGTTIKHLYIRNLLTCELAFPSIAEQRAIVAALESVEAQIGALRVRLRKAKSIKAGLMQQLLTGRTRLTISEGVS